MPSRINSTTTSPGGLISTGDSDNTLLIQTGDTTAITVNGSQQVSLTNPLGISSGGTGASTAANARTALGLAIGTDVLAPNGSGASLTNLNASNLASGTVPTARLASGTANSTTYLRGDQTWATISAGLTGLRGQVFTSNGTFTIPSGVTQVKVTVQGGGGGGSWGIGFGGGGGGCAIKYLTGLTSGNTLSVTVGGAGTGANTGATNGGNSSVSSGSQSITTITGSGGVSGSNGASGGGTSGGDLSISGASAVGVPCGPVVNIGGNSFLGITFQWSAGRGYGAGGAPVSGGGGYNGSQGVVIFEW